MRVEINGEQEGISLGNLFPEASFSGQTEARFRACTSDARACRRGDLFVAVTGADEDGHQQIDLALARGAAGIVIEQPLPGLDVPVWVVPDSRAALGVVCQALAGDPSLRLPVIGITGTSGKTTTSCLTSSIFRAAGFRTGLAGTLGYCDGRRTWPASITTPEAAVLAEWLSRSENEGCTHAILEVSSHALAQRRLSGVELDVACVTNVRHDHLDFHGTPSNYRAAKERIFSHLRSGGVGVLNMDDAVCREYLSRLDSPALTYAMNNEAEVTATLLERYPSEQTFLLTAGDESAPVRTMIVGDHHIRNCLAAATIALIHDIDLPTIVRGLEQVNEMPGRMQRIECGQQFSVYVDAAQSPATMQTVLSTLQQVTAGRVICVFGADGQQDRGPRPRLGRIAERHSDMLILTDGDPRGESPDRIIAEVLGGCRAPDDVAIIPDRAAAIQWALALAAPGDSVLIAGKGDRRSPSLGRKRSELDDREIARRFLYSTAAESASHSFGTVEYRRAA